jgi:hypothetical protein
LRGGARTNAIPSSCWKSVHKESSFLVYALSTPETSNLPSIQLYEHENRHVGRPKAWGSTDGRTGIDMEKVDTTDRLTRLRELMQKHKVDIYSM